MMQLELTDSQVSEMWWSTYHAALDELGVDRSGPMPVRMDALLERSVIVGGDHPRARRAADAWVKRHVLADQWRNFRNDQTRQKREGPAMQRTVASIPNRGLRQRTKQR